MSEFRAAHRYARAVLENAETQKAVDRVSGDFEIIGELMKTSREFLLFLRSPVINKVKKKTVIRELLGKRISDVTHAFLALLASKNREMILPEIIQEFYRLRDERMGISNATVHSVVPLTKEQEQQLVTRLEQVTKKRIRLHPVIDKQLKGGLTVQIGDTVWDGSVSHQLALLRERFTDGASTAGSL